MFHVGCCDYRKGYLKFSYFSFNIGGPLGRYARIKQYLEEDLHEAKWLPKIIVNNIRLLHTPSPKFLEIT